MNGRLTKTHKYSIKPSKFQKQSDMKRCFKMREAKP